MQALWGGGVKSGALSPHLRLRYLQECERKEGVVMAGLADGFTAWEEVRER